ncbi:hypothetical protein OEZ85_008740 [Tetradesmus obliquus]|uniref:Oxidized purine nucleoside triphosphate hydrolase n=1 Tax=Tetradesmus obliquus TaxID=3088 RepID=A0ABY8TPD5_TETOB|nr:hypothetical protein OEZ85_008740 [Tetradesmus obliquus]
MACPSFVRELLHSTKPKLFTLAIVEKNGRLLLGLKKTGFGSGYYNGFGGKVEPGETIAQAAHRELQEEAGITATSLQHRGVLTFAFDDQQLPWEVHVYRVPDYTGEPCESQEMAPVWMHPQELPYDKMWADDRWWYPVFLRGASFQGVFAFTNTTQLVWHNLQEVEEPGKLPATELLTI